MEVRSTQIFELKQEPGDPLYQVSLAKYVSSTWIYNNIIL